MKIDFDHVLTISPLRRANRCAVTGETDRLTDVLLCPPTYLEAVPCCSVTRESLRNGFTSSREVAGGQHAALRRALERCGVSCHALAPAPGMPDLSFTRDVAVTTPRGLVALNPALGHRAVEVDHFVAWAERHTHGPVARISAGTIEGGDVCVARPGLLIVGISGTRTNQAGAEEFAEPFAVDGWDVLFCHFDEHFLHLDTIFCMVDAHRALACLDVLDEGFIDAVRQRGIDLLPVSYKESRLLGCNILSVDGQRIIAGASTPRVAAMLRQHGFAVTEVDLDQFSACGGGVHCLTMPLAREASESASSVADTRRFAAAG